MIWLTEVFFSGLIFLLQIMGCTYLNEQCIFPLNYGLRKMSRNGIVFKILSYFVMLSSQFFTQFFKIYFNWRLITLQYCGFAIIHLNQTWVYMCSPSWPSLPPPSPSHPSGSSQCTSPEHLSHASNLDWWSISQMIIYMF